MNAENLEIAAAIDARVQDLFRSGSDRIEIFTEMIDHMPAFKRLMDTSPQGEMDELCRRFPAFYYYAKILEAVATGISTGEIKVP